MRLITHIRDVIEDYLIPYRAREFAEFVWGKDFEKFILHCEDTVHIWNEKYQEYLKLYPEGDPAKDIPQMIAVWLRIK